MEALRIITEEHQNLWRIATTLDMVANEIDGGGHVETAFFTSLFDYIDQFMDRAHHAKEDSYLFPALRQLSGQGQATMVRGKRMPPFPKLEAHQFDVVFLDPPRYAKSPFGVVDLVNDYAALF